MKEIIINVSGDLDPVTGSELYLKVKELLADPYRILLDMTHLRKIDETGKVYLQKIRDRVQPPSRIAVCGPADVLEPELQTVLPLFNTRQEAKDYLLQNEPAFVTVQYSYCPVCGTGIDSPPGNVVCPSCSTSLYIHSGGRATAYERLF